MSTSLVGAEQNALAPLAPLGKVELPPPPALTAVPTTKAGRLQPLCDLTNLSRAELRPGVLPSIKEGFGSSVDSSGIENSLAPAPRVIEPAPVPVNADQSDDVEDDQGLSSIPEGDEGDDALGATMFNGSLFEVCGKQLDAQAIKAEKEGRGLEVSNKPPQPLARLVISAEAPPNATTAGAAAPTAATTTTAATAGSGGGGPPANASPGAYAAPKDYHTVSNAKASSPEALSPSLRFYDNDVDVTQAGPLFDVDDIDAAAYLDSDDDEPFDLGPTVPGATDPMSATAALGQTDMRMLRERLYGPGAHPHLHAADDPARRPTGGAAADSSSGGGGGGARDQLQHPAGLDETLFGQTELRALCAKLGALDAGGGGASFGLSTMGGGEEGLGGGGLDETLFGQTELRALVARLDADDAARVARAVELDKLEAEIENEAVHEAAEAAMMRQRVEVMEQRTRLEQLALERKVLAEAEALEFGTSPLGSDLQGGGLWGLEGGAGGSLLGDTLPAARDGAASPSTLEQLWRREAAALHARLEHAELGRLAAEARASVLADERDAAIATAVDERMAHDAADALLEDASCHIVKLSCENGELQRLVTHLMRACDEGEAVAKAAACAAASAMEQLEAVAAREAEKRDYELRMSDGEKRAFGLEKTRASINKAVAEAYRLPEEERGKKIRALRQKWHPDKHDVLKEMAEEVSKMINEAVEKNLVVDEL